MFNIDHTVQSIAIIYIYLLTEPPRKLNKVENILQKEPQKEPLKQKKLDEHSHTLVTPPQSPFMQDNVSQVFFSNILLICVYKTLMNYYL